MKAVGISDIGRCRKNNEDAYYLAEEDAPLQHLYIVADGMGGCNAGEVASNGAIEAFVDYVAEHKEIQEIPDLLTGAFQAANKSVFDQSNSAIMWRNIKKYRKFRICSQALFRRLTNPYSISPIPPWNLRKWEPLWLQP